MPPTRRALFALLAAPLASAWPVAAAQPAARSSRVPPLGAAYFPRVALRTHDGKRVRFYEDLIKGKVVAINFMFTSCSSFCPRATANLIKVQRHLGARLGVDVHMLSITVDPDRDTPDVLNKYAIAHQTMPGWEFLTGEKGDIDQIRRKLGVFDDDPDKTQHTGILTYGNEATGSWAAMPVIAAPAVIARTLIKLIVRRVDAPPAALPRGLAS
jgi:protein SCO1